MFLIATIIIAICFLALIIMFPYVYCEHFEYITTEGPFLYSVNEEHIYDVINLFSEVNDKNHPDNFMELGSSSDDGAGQNNNINNNDKENNDNKNSQLYKEKIEKDIEVSSKLNPSTGGSQSSKIPQTEFEKQPYLDNNPLPKSQSDPTSLGEK